MRKFSDFLNEYGTKLPFVGGTQRTGYFNLPDLANLHEPGYIPTGKQSFQQTAQSASQLLQMRDKDEYLTRQTLEKIKALAENVMSAIMMREAMKKFNNGQEVDHRRYEIDYATSRYDPNKKIIYGLLKSEIIGGHYPQLKNEEMQHGINLEVLSVYGKEIYAIQIDKLNTVMLQLKEKLSKKEIGYSAAQNVAGMGDEIFQRSLQGKANLPDMTTAS